MIIVFPFIVLKYFSFCCHSSHSVLCCNRLVYSCFVLFVKSDIKSKSKLFLLVIYSFYLFFVCYPSLFIVCFLNLTFLISGSYFLCILSFLLLCLFFTLSFLLFCFYVTLSLSLLCLFSFCFSVTLSLYHSFFPIILSLCHSVFFCYSVSFHLFVALPFFFFPLSFWLYFYSFICLFFDIFA